MTLATEIQHETVIPYRAGGVAPVASRSDQITDQEFGHDVVFGMLVGTPLIWLVSFGIALAAGVGFGNAAGVATVPAIFCGTFYGGLIPLMSRLYRAERASTEPRVNHTETPADRGLRQAA